MKEVPKDSRLTSHQILACKNERPAGYALRILHAWEMYGSYKSKAIDGEDKKDGLVLRAWVPGHNLPLLAACPPSGPFSSSGPFELILKTQYDGKYVCCGWEKGIVMSRPDGSPKSFLSHTLTRFF